MRFNPSLTDKLSRRLGRPLTPEEAHLLVLAETILEEEQTQPLPGDTSPAAQ